MERRKFVLGLGSLAAGGAAATGSGAFSAMTADRVANISVVNDADGLIGIEAGLDSDIVTGTADGELEIAVPDEYGAQGLNNNSIYQLGHYDESEVHYHDGHSDNTGEWLIKDGDPTSEYAFKITNQDTVAHEVTIDGTDTFGDVMSSSWQTHVAVGLYNPALAGKQYGGAQQARAIDSGGEGPRVSVNNSDLEGTQKLEPGNSVYITVKFDTTHSNVEIDDGDLNGTFTISST